MFPREQAVIFNSKSLEPFNIPNIYTYYSYTLSVSLTLSNEAIDFILTCENAETLIFHDETGDFTSRLMHRVDEWENMKNLRFLMLNVNKKQFANIKLREFFRRFPALQTLSIKLDIELNSKHFDKFLEEQSIPNAWEQHVGKYTYIHFHRKY